MSGTTRAQFVRFTLVGVAGFIADAGTLYVAMRWLSAGHYTGRVLSFLVAATVSWTLNRRYTFTANRGANRSREWSRFLAANAVGGLLNYTVYATLVASSEMVAAIPTLGVAAGSLAGLAVNFTLSKKVVFTGTEPPR